MFCPRNKNRFSREILINNSCCQSARSQDIFSLRFCDDIVIGYFGNLTLYKRNVNIFGGNKNIFRFIYFSVAIICHLKEGLAIYQRYKWFGERFPTDRPQSGSVTSYKNYNLHNLLIKDKIFLVNSSFENLFALLIIFSVLNLILSNLFTASTILSIVGFVKNHPVFPSTTVSNAPPFL